jgi:hypothetical protein
MSEYKGYIVEVFWHKAVKTSKQAFMAGHSIRLSLLQVIVYVSQ